MSSQPIRIKFNNQDRPEFIKDLRKRVDTYFKENKISKFANASMKFKTVFMLGLYYLPFVFILSGLTTSAPLIYGMWALMGFGMAGIGLTVMHDANHGAYSKKQGLNKRLGYTMNLLGAYHITWKIQHNVLHHTYTNVHQRDEDISNEVMRFSPNEKRKSGYRLQMVYAIFLYGLLSLHRLISKDFEQLARYSRLNLLAGQGLTFKKALLHSILIKIGYYSLMLVLPMLLSPMVWWMTLLGFLLMHYISGIILALIFQAAHISEETEFFKANEEGTMENSWAVHQMKTTTNFGTKSKALTWFVGGLNHQVEHHLFPSICHVHYSELAKIVEQTAQDHDVEYNNEKSLFTALRSHFKFMNKLGMAKYDTEFG
jgi:linoleoyl-CoA desaturase